MIKQVSLTPVANFSTVEQDTGRKWVDGRSIYVKTLSLSGITGTGVKTVAHNITGIDMVLTNHGYVVLASGAGVPIPRVSTDVTTFGIYFYGWDATTLTGYIGTNYTTTSALASGYVTIEYIKA
jgi:hypothetical protein